jgi:hypothetical protein
MRRIVVTSMVVAALVLAGCGGGGGDAPPDQTQAGGADSGGTKTPAGSDDGVSKDITLTPDTVVVNGDGGKALKSFGTDGKSLVIDAGAKGADQLAPGKILLLTGVTVVRVASLQRTGDKLEIVGAPVTLPEVILDGELAWEEQNVDPDDARVLVAGGAGASSTGQPATGSPGLPGIGGMGGGGDGGEVPINPEDLDLFGGDDIYGMDDGEPAANEIALAAPQLVAFTGPRLVAGKTISGEAGAASFDVTYEPAGRGHHVLLQLHPKGELSGTIAMDVNIKSLSHAGRGTIHEGKVQNFEFDMADMSGDAVITTDLVGLQNVASYTTPPFFKLPFSIEFPAIVGGIPFTLSLSSTIQIALSMALANSTLKGKAAELTFGGPAGFHFKAGGVTLVGAEERTQESKSILDLLHGVAPGPVGIVVTTELPKVGFGFGFLQTGAGVFISNGMVGTQTLLPMPAKCTAINVAYVLAAGVEAKFLGREFEIARKAFVDKRWNYQVPADARCNAAP